MFTYLLRFTAVLLFLCSFYGSAASVFKVVKGNNTLYLGGTMHMLSKSDYPLPNAYKTAYELSDTLVFETDLSAMSTPEFQQRSQQFLMYTDGTTLDDVLSASTLVSLKSHLTQRGVPYDAFKLMKPGFAGISLSVIELTRMGLTPQGVDAYYHMMAIGDGKTINWLETPEQQLSFLTQMGKDDPDSFIRYTLNDIDNMPASIDELRTTWRSGDMEALNAVGIAPWEKDYPDIYQIILANRNHQWMPAIRAMLESTETEFVLVGALHLAGTDGLLTLLEAQGYTVSKL